MENIVKKYGNGLSNFYYRLVWMISLVIDLYIGYILYKNNLSNGLGIKIYFTLFVVYYVSSIITFIRKEKDYLTFWRKCFLLLELISFIFKFSLTIVLISIIKQNLLFILLIILFILLFIDFISRVTGIVVKSILIGVFALIVTTTLVEIKGGLIEWTFISLLFLTVIDKFFDDKLLKLIQSETLFHGKVNFLGILSSDNTDSVNGELFRRKILFLLYFPVLYLTLLISNGIISSDNFLFFINDNYDSHFSTLDNLSQVFQEIPHVTFYIIVIKSLVLFVLTINFCIYKEWLLRFIAKIVYFKDISINDKSKKLHYGIKYYRLKKEEEWTVNEEEYLKFYENDRFKYNKGIDSFCDYRKKNRKLIFKYNNKSVKKSFKVLSDDVILFDGYPYISNKSILNNLKNKDFDSVKRYFEEFDFSSLFFSLFITILIFSPYILSNYSLDNYRGTYVQLVVKGEELDYINWNSPLTIDSEKFIKSDRVYTLNPYSRDFTSKDEKFSGYYRSNGVLVIKKLGSDEKEYFVREDSSYYKSIINNLSSNSPSSKQSSSN